jgi:hypothetical protein
VGIATRSPIKYQGGEIECEKWYHNKSGDTEEYRLAVNHAEPHPQRQSCGCRMSLLCTWALLVPQPVVKFVEASLGKRNYNVDLLVSNAV